MSFGLDIFESGGDLTYSTSDVTWNQVDFFQVNAGGSASNSYPSISGRSVLTAQFWINGPPANRKAIAHSITVSGTNVSASGGSEDAYVMVLMK